MISGRRIWLISLVVLSTVVLLSCPTPIDQDLLRLVEDNIVPAITIDTPYPNSLYGATVLVEGNLSDSSFAPGDGKGLLQTLYFSVLGEAMLSRIIEFSDDGTYTVTPPDSNPEFTFDPSTGSFSIDFSTVGLNGGPKVLVLELVDFNGNETEKTLTLLEDPSGPWVDLELPAHGTVYDLTVTIHGFAFNSDSDHNTNDVNILRWEVPAAGLSDEVDLQLNPLGTAFSFDPETGEFNHWFSTVGISGDIFFIFEALDYAGHKTRVSVQLSGNRPGPQITVLSPNPENPGEYSSAKHSTFVVTGKVSNQDIDWSNFTYLASGSLSGVKAGIISVPYHNPFVPEDDFVFQFDPKDAGIAGVMTIKINATDASGNRNSSVEFYVDDDPVAPTITVDSLQTNDTRPELTGTIDDDTATITIGVAGNYYSGSNVSINGSGPWTWRLANDAISPALGDGTYNVSAQASDALGNTGYDGTSGELTIDTSASVTVDSSTTSVRSPELTGTTDGDIATITVTVEGKSYSGSDITISFNNPNWVWTLAAGTISPNLSIGTYDVVAEVVDLLGNTGSDESTDELTIE